MAKRNSVIANLDWVTIFIYLALVFLGWINIYAAIFNEENSSIFDLSQRYGKQLIWIIAASLLIFLILIIEARFYVFFAYVFYGIMVFLLFLVLFIGTKVNGATSWIYISGVGFQPAEFAKFATGLALAKYITTHGFKMQNARSLLLIALIILLPAFLIVIQNDTGSALVYIVFLLVLYREGLSGIVLFFGLFIGLLFILSLVLSNLALLLILLVTALIGFYFISQKFKNFIKIVGVVFLVSGFLIISDLVLGLGYGIEKSLLFGSVFCSFVFIFFALRKKMYNALILIIIFLGSILLSVSVDYAFENILGNHQQERINELLGIQSDPLGAGYNVNQSKIAIGSGGLSGKGFLRGTQTKFDFVPEQSTDFIFCTVGEEWGFIGTSFVLGLFVFLLLRLVFLAERQRSAFSRVYGYSVVVILFFHIVVNIGMTIGLMPVIGIPLPFFSYGGSSLWSFTILLFIFLRLDASRYENMS